MKGLNLSLEDVLSHPIRSWKISSLFQRVQKEATMTDFLTFMGMLSKLDPGERKDQPVPHLHACYTIGELFTPVFRVLFDPINRWKAVEAVEWLIKRFKVTEDEINALYVECRDMLIVQPAGDPEMTAEPELFAEMEAVFAQAKNNALS